MYINIQYSTLLTYVMLWHPAPLEKEEMLGVHFIKLQSTKQWLSVYMLTRTH